MDLTIDEQNLLTQANYYLNLDYSEIPEVFYVPTYYNNPELHNSFKLTLEQYATGSLTLALASKYDFNYAKKAIKLIANWVDKNKQVSSKEDSFLALIYKGQKFLTAISTLINLQYMIDIPNLENWINCVYLYACESTIIERWSRPNNTFYWGYLGKLLVFTYIIEDVELQKNLLIQSKGFFSDSIKKINGMLGYKNELWRENLRNNSFLWYTYFSLAPMSVIAWIDKKYFDNDDLLNQLELPMVRFFDFITKEIPIPNRFPYKKYTGWKGKIQNLVWPSENDFVWVEAPHLFEIMGKLYNNPNFTDYASKYYPIGNDGNVWCFPTYRINNNLL